ncbi:NAD-dependent epimerase/dehydratase family protein [Pelagibacteraceae bacterium]|nr:NAD-dependent epimerase/dehydratase family protein [Pelagibacteraceae bacterium]
MNILITGGSGFIGKHLANRLSNNNKVYIFDKKPFKNKHKNIKFISGDIKNYNNLKKIKKINIIYHLAAQTSAEISEEHPFKDIKTNIFGTYNVCKFAINNNVKEVIFTSSMAVYGGSKHKISETNFCNPSSIYGMSKLFGEKLIRNLSKNKINYKIFRLFNVYGPGQDLKNLKQGMVSIYLYQLLKNNKIVVKGSLERFRDFIYIDDLIDIMLMKNIKYNNIFNVGSGKKTKVKNLLKLIEKVSKKKIKVIKSKGTPGDIHGNFADISKLKKNIKFKLNTSIERGLAKMISSIKL